MYEYKYPHPAITADCVVFGVDCSGECRLLLIERGNDPCKGKWAFPGGFMNIDETAEECASRELSEETGLEIEEWKEIGVFSDVHRDPRERVVTVAYCAVVFCETLCGVKGNDDARKAVWFKLTELPSLAFDHEKILEKALTITGFCRTKHLTNLLLGAAVGDICGSTYEFAPCKDYDVLDITREESDYTDDSVCTFAVAKALMDGEDMTRCLQTFCRNDFLRGYGNIFSKWLFEPNPKPYNSYGNGSAMRCSAAGFMAKSKEECVYLAEKTAECTHNHQEGIKGAVATSLAIFYLKQGKDKDFVRKNILDFYYPEWSDFTIDGLRAGYSFDESCQRSVPVSILAFLESADYEDCIKKSISVGGDADTLAAIAGGMAYMFYKHIPERLLKQAYCKLPAKMLEINVRFDAFVNIPL